MKPPRAAHRRGQAGDEVTMSAKQLRGRAKLSRRSALILALSSLTAASAPASSAGPALTRPLPAEPAAPRGSVILKPIAHWTDIFLQGWDYDEEYSLPLSESPDSWDHYNVSYSVDACTAMFRATGERRYLDRALQFVENVAAAATLSSSLPNSRYRDRYHGWASSRSGEGGDEIPLYESYFWRYATALLVAMTQSRTVHDDPNYRSRYDRLLRFAEVDIFEKWYSRDPADHIYRERTHMAAHWALIALYLSQITSDPVRRTRYLDVVDNIDLHLPGRQAGLRGQLRRHPAEPTAYFWSDVWGSARLPGQDVSHANGVIAYVAEACDRGRTWTKADMAAFSALLTKVIWPGGSVYRSYVDGTGSDNGWFSDGFVKLGRYDPAVQRRLETHQVVNDQFAANMALNVRLLNS